VLADGDDQSEVRGNWKRIRKTKASVRKM